MGQREKARHRTARCLGQEQDASSLVRVRIVRDMTETEREYEHEQPENRQSERRESDNPGHMLVLHHQSLRFKRFKDIRPMRDMFGTVGHIDQPQGVPGEPHNPPSNRLWGRVEPKRAIEQRLVRRG